MNLITKLLIDFGHFLKICIYTQNLFSTYLFTILYSVYIISILDQIILGLILLHSTGLDIMCKLFK